MLGLGKSAVRRRSPLNLKGPPKAPPGEIVYAIGDVHGCSDLLFRLLVKISDDAAQFPQAQVVVLTLGDYVDRGPNSRAVIEMLSRLKVKGGERMVALKGNHEAALLDFLEDPARGAVWCEFGGRETMTSYGVEAPVGRDLEAWTACRDAFAAALPAHHLDFLQSLEVTARVGDYLFVHAGLRPGVPIEQQVEKDLLWIRDEFLKAKPWVEPVIVHGHTPTEGPVEALGRIGVDTGAYASGVLTAVRLQGESRSFIQATAADPAEGLGAAPDAKDPPTRVRPRSAARRNSGS